MKVEEQRKPAYLGAGSVEHLEGLIPGDRVIVENDGTSKWMVFQKLDHGEGNTGLNSGSTAYFIEIHEHYSSDCPFSVWESKVNDLRFDMFYIIHLSNTNKNLTKVEPGTEQHAEVKTLADMLV